MPRESFGRSTILGRISRLLGYMSRLLPNELCKNISQPHCGRTWNSRSSAVDASFPRLVSGAKDANGLHYAAGQHDHCTPRIMLVWAIYPRLWILRHQDSHSPSIIHSSPSIAHTCAVLRENRLACITREAIGVDRPVCPSVLSGRELCLYVIGDLLVATSRVFL